MIKIAHRGNVDGPNQFNENNPTNIVVAIVRGFNVEVDIWMNSTGIFLGHDKPQYEIDEQFINDIKDETWFHCKNIEALGYFVNNIPDAKFFWHQDDDYTLTSNGYIWTYPGKTITNKSIVVLTEPTDLEIYKDAYGVCTDYLV
jgi:phospholipase C